MGTPIIAIEKLGKRYSLRHQSGDRYTALRDVLADKAKTLFRRNASNPNSAMRSALKEDFWALKDLSFEVVEGEVVGIIGRNGAGKSTLLKVISRITEPTTGRIRLRGRIASLLEVGTGFHPELTGRENIYLNGAILGMTRLEIKSKFDEIVAFAEIEKFLDTPVKRYSSGMYVRLAFAVAAHLEPEVLVIDEVLAVGDADFQKKCLGKIGQVAKAGRTVLFVSHNMTAVAQLCKRALLLDRGSIVQDSCDVSNVIKRYMFTSDATDGQAIWDNSDHQVVNGYFTPTRFLLCDGGGRQAASVQRNDAEIYVQIEGQVEQLDPALTIGFAIFAEDGALLFWTYHTDEAEENWPKIRKGRCTLRTRLPSRMLNEGQYRIEMIASLNYREWLIAPSQGGPEITLIIQSGLSESPNWLAKRPGLLAPVLSWTSTIQQDCGSA